MALETTSIARMIRKVRQMTDEPSAGVKYTDEHILDYLRNAFESVLVDLNNNAENPIVARHDVVIVADLQSYVLPPTVGEVLMISKVNPTSDVDEWQLTPTSRWNPSGPGFTFEGNIIRFTPIWREAETLRVTFIPTGDVDFHVGTPADASASTLTLANGTSNIAIGRMDFRENAYAGSMLRVIETGRTQERIISTYDVATQIATVVPDWGTTPTPASTTYEIVPLLSYLLETMVSVWVASLILSMEGDMDRKKMLEMDYIKMRRALSIRMSNHQTITGNLMVSDTASNRYRQTWGLGVFGTQ